MLFLPPWWAYPLCAAAIAGSTALRVQERSVGGGVSITLHVLSNVLFVAPVLFAVSLLTSLGYPKSIAIFAASLAGGYALDRLSRRTRRPQRRA